MVEEGQKMMEKAPAPIPKATEIPPATKTPALLPPVNIKPVIKKAEPKPTPPAKVTKPAEKKAPAPSIGLTTLSKKMTSGPYVVQMASFQTQKYADAEQRKLKSMIPDIFVEKTDLGAKGVWYRLRAYNGISYEEAKAKAAEVAKRTKYKPYPMKK